MLLGPRTAIASGSASAAPDSSTALLAELVYDFVRRRGGCPIPLLHLVAVSRLGLTPPRLHPPLGLAIAFTLGSLR